MARLGTLILGLGLCAACGPVAREARPDGTTAADALGEKCAKGGDPQPLVVDLNATERADLEVAMRQGVAVVSYDCEHLRVVANCTLDGRYDYIGVTPKDQELELADTDEIKANLPAGVIAASVSGEVQRGASLHVKLSIVGKRMSNITEGMRERMRGSCGGATHFVRAVTTGAFTVETETRAAAHGQAAALGASTESKGESTRKMHQTDGDRASCATASASASAPPSMCAAPLRLDLIALGSAPPAQRAAAGASPGGGCPGGLVWSAGACRTPRVNTPHKCLRDDVEECRRQCEMGDASSCTEIGFEHLVGRLVQLDRTQAAGYFRKACDGGDPWGCNSLGALLVSTSDAASQRQGVALFERACGEEPRVCSNLAVAHRDGIAMAASPARATEIFSRGCLGGAADSCFDLGLAYDKGIGVARDIPRAAELQAESCRRGFMQGCAVMGIRHLYGNGVTKHENTAVQFFRAACDGKNQLGCGMYGFAVMTGLGGVQRDPRGGRNTMEQACHSGSADTCAILAATLESQGDPAGAKQWYGEACKAGLKDHCGK